MYVKPTHLMPHFKRETFYYRSNFINLIRPMTLTETLTPILTIAGLVALEGYFHLSLFIATLFTSILIQSAVNILNDFFDFASGQDQNKWTQVYEKSNGSLFQFVPIYAIGLLVFAMITGVWIVMNSNVIVLFVGLMGVILGIFYSAGHKSLASLGLGELTAALTMGTIVPWTTYLIQTGEVNLTLILASLPFAFLIASMILTNNIRDMKKDIGFRNTLAMRVGVKNAIVLLASFLSSPYIIIMVLVATGVLPFSLLSVLLALPIALHLLKGVKQQDEKINVMKWAAYHHWAFGVLYAGNIWLAVWFG